MLHGVVGGSDQFHYARLPGSFDKKKEKTTQSSYEWTYCEGAGLIALQI